MKYGKKACFTKEIAKNLENTVPGQLDVIL